MQKNVEEINNKLNKKIEENKNEVNILKKKKLQYFPLLNYYINNIKVKENISIDIKNDTEKNQIKYLCKIEKINKKYETVKMLEKKIIHLKDTYEYIIKQNEELNNSSKKVKKMINVELKERTLIISTVNSLLELLKKYDEINLNDLYNFISTFKKNYYDKIIYFIFCTFINTNYISNELYNKKILTKKYNEDFILKKKKIYNINNLNVTQYDNLKFNKKLNNLNNLHNFQNNYDIIFLENMFIHYSDSEKNTKNEQNFNMNEFKIVIEYIKEFDKIYNECLIHLKYEKIKNEKGIKILNKLKLFYNNRNQKYIEKINELEKDMKYDNEIRDSIKICENNLSYYVNKKKKIEKKLNKTCNLIRNLEIKEKKKKKNIMLNKYNIYEECKTYYVTIKLLFIFLDLSNIIDKQNNDQKIKLQQMKKELCNKEAIKTEINEIRECSNKIKEKIFSIEEQKRNLEKTQQTIIKNIDLLNFQKQVLEHHKNYINYLKKLRDYFYKKYNEKRTECYNSDDEENKDEENKDEENEDEENEDVENKDEENEDEENEKNNEIVEKINIYINELKKNYEKSKELQYFISNIFECNINYTVEINKFINEEKEQINLKIDKNINIINTLKKNIAQSDGQLKLRMIDIEKIKNELNSNLYCDVDQKYKKAIVKNFVNKCIIKDLNNFQGVLDEAIIKFHSLKMQEINNSIKNLWRRVYTNSDIDYIYIKSEIQKVDSEKKSLRASYNYRVVMVKNNCELDMKGRCSSGQKVLASIIIRLALAESFSIKCGILALDEPTTNLDKANTKNLANLIANIVDLRKDSATFQLILITHDNYFVNVLSEHGLTNCFYKISKDENGYSTIQNINY